MRGRYGYGWFNFQIGDCLFVLLNIASVLFDAVVDSVHHYQTVLSMAINRYVNFQRISVQAKNIMCFRFIHALIHTSVTLFHLTFSGVRVEALNAAFSQDDLIEHEAHAVVCTLPLGVLKESIKHPQQFHQESTSSTPSKSHPGPQSASGSDYTVAALTCLTSPLFQPALPDWKVEAINRLGFGVLNKVRFCLM